ncbi:MAG TPA: LCP family protein [Anaerolineales bacterium]|jgi:LCP family protein required for cell wall assembly
MTKPAAILAVIFSLMLCSCAAPAEPEPEPYSPYIIVSAAADATATPTPFQPSGKSSQAAEGPQPGTPVASLPVPAVSATPFPTSTPPLEPQPSPEVLTEAQPVIDAPESITILLLGSDTRQGSSFRTDTIMIAVVRPKDGQVSLISIPRDLWVNIPTEGMQRINTAYQIGEITGYEGGGAGLLKDTILFNLGIKIDHTAMVDFDGFRKTIDTIGGVDVPVSCPYTDWRLLDPTYDPEDENNWFMYTAGPGLLHMNGDLSLWYARSRKHSNDFDRGRRQQEVIRAIYAQVLRGALLTRLPQLYSDLSSSFTTDLGLADILKFSPMALHLTNASIRSFYIAGELVTSWITPGGAYVLLPNTELIQQMLATAMSASARQQEREKITVEIQNGSPNDGWETLAAERLNYAGYQTSFQAADNRAHQTSLLYDLTPDQDHSRSASLLSVLGLPDSALVSVPTKNSKVAYALIVGADYKACFDPAGLTP